MISKGFVQFGVWEVVLSGVVVWCVRLVGMFKGTGVMGLNMGIEGFERRGG